MEERREMVLYEGKEGDDKEYPEPLFTNEEICSDPGIFVDALRRFHSLMGTKFMIPVIGGKDLNLHLLYVEVTQRGGLEKVIMEKRWREVIAIFNFPPTTTSASFVLRKYYLSLLHHFEQVYFFGARGVLVPPAEALQTRTQLCKLDDMVRSDPGAAMRRKRAFPPPAIIQGVNMVPEYANKEQQFHRSQYIESLSPYGRKRTVETLRQIPNGHFSAESNSLHLQGSTEHNRPTTAPHSAPPNDGAESFAASASIPPADGSMPSATGGGRNFSVTGTIDSKFDYGYFVTVKIGSEQLHGVLYHIHQHPTASPPSSLNPPQPSPTTPSIAAATVGNANSSFVPATRSSGRRRRLKNRDPARPKPNRSAYNFFFAEKHFQLKAQCPNMEREYSKRIGESWNKLTQEERQLFDGHARRDKERYKKELQIYKERFKLLEPKQSQATTREIDAPPRIHESERIDIAQSMETAILKRDMSVGEDIEMEKQETTRRGEMQDFESSEKCAKIVESADESGKEGMNTSMMEIDMMKMDSTDVNI